MVSGEMFDNAIVGVDDADAGRDAVALAMRLASGRRSLAFAHVEVVALTPPDSAGTSESADCRRAMQRLASLADEAGVDADVTCVQARSVASGLHGLGVSRRADLLVIGASRRDELDHALVGDETREVMRHAPCAVAVAPRGFATRPPVMRKIGVAYDGSSESAQALALARTLAREQGAELSAFHAVPEPDHAGRRTTGARLVNDPWSAQAEIDEAVETARSQIAQLGDVEPYATSGDAVEELARYGASVDLLIAGSHNYTPLEAWMSVQSTSQQLADSAPCPLVVLSSYAQFGPRRQMRE
jgi:nucleotide-binding universal stress UspA family protein